MEKHTESLSCGIKSSESQSWIHESCGCTIKQLLHRLRALAEQHLRVHDLSISQFAVLAMLEEEPGLSSANLAQRCDVTPQTMNGVVVNLEHAGLIQREADPQHGRILQTVLTKKGQQVLKDAHQQVKKAEDTMLADLSKQEQQEFRRLLSVCLNTLRQLDGE